MSRSYIEIYDPSGKIQLSRPISDYHSLERGRAEMSVGQLLLMLPVSYADLFMKSMDAYTDIQLRVFRSIADETAKLDLGTFWFVDDVTEVQDSEGKEFIEVRAKDSIEILNRRVIPYEATDSQSDKTGPAGNLMKAFVRENFGALATDATRNLSAYLTVDADTGDGATIDVAVQRPTVLSALQETARISAQNGSYISFDIVCDPTTGLMKFRTFPGQRGTDRRHSSSSPVYIGRNLGNITNVRLNFSNAGEVNYVYALGGSIGKVKISEERQAAQRVLASPFNRREYVLSDGNEIDLDVLDNLGDQYIREHRPRNSITGDLAETSSFVFDLHYSYGDYVTVDDKNRNFDARLSAITIKDEGGETITASIVGDSV